MELLLSKLEMLDNSALVERERLLFELKMDEVAKVQTDVMMLRKWKETVDLVYQEALQYGDATVDTRRVEDSSKGVVEQVGVDDSPKSVGDDKVGRIILLNIVYCNIPVAKILPLVMEVVISKKPFDVVNFPKTKKLNLNKQNFSYNQADIKSIPKKLINGMYVELDNTFEEVKEICYAMITECGFEKNEIKFE